MKARQFVVLMAIVIFSVVFVLFVFLQINVTYTVTPTGPKSPVIQAIAGDLPDKEVARIIGKASFQELRESDPLYGTAVHAAVYVRRISMIKILADQGLSVLAPAQVFGCGNVTPLELAIWLCDNNAVRQVLEVAGPSAVNPNELKRLMALAQEAGLADIFETLKTASPLNVQDMETPVQPRQF